MRRISLKGAQDVGKRIDILTLLYDKAVAKIEHSDTFRQRNLNYALVIFAGLMALGSRPETRLPRAVISGTLFVLMVIFCVWDRRWHKNKHGWDLSSRMFYRKLCQISNSPDRDVIVRLYYVRGEKTAEWCSMQPILFYCLVAGSVLSYFVFGSLASSP